MAVRVVAGDTWSNANGKPVLTPRCLRAPPGHGMVCRPAPSASLTTHTRPSGLGWGHLMPPRDPPPLLTRAPV